MLIYLIDIFFPCNNIWPRAKFFLCSWHVHKTWAKNVIKKIGSTKEWAKVLCALGRIMYSQGCPIDSHPILWAKQQIDSLETSFLNGARFIQYLKEHWLLKEGMWCVANWNILHVGQDANLLWSHSIATWRNFYILQKKGSLNIIWIGWFTIWLVLF
jgi:hypothetical protein